MMARVLVIRQGQVPLDPRVWRDIQALVRDGHQVDVVSRRVRGLSNFERMPGVAIHRLPLYEGRGGPWRYLFQYVLFFLMAAVFTTYLHLRRRYQLVQVHSVPDVLVLAAIAPKLLGVPVVLDLQEPMPEFFASKFSLPVSHSLVRLIARLEQLSIRFADHVLTPNDQMRDTFVRRGAPAKKITVIVNSADPDIFDAAQFPPRPRTAGKFDLICHGTVEERYGIDTVIKAVALLRNEIPELRFHVYGEGSYLPAMRALTEKLGLQDRIWFSSKFVPIGDLLAAIADADVGIVAMKRDVFRDITLCNKMFDFVAMRRPAIVSRTAAVEAYFDDACFEMFESDDACDLARAIRCLHASPARCQRLVERAAFVNQRYCWPSQRQTYLSTVHRLMTGKSASGAADPEIETTAAAERRKW